MGISFHLETNSHMSVKSPGTMLQDISEQICPLICFKAGSKTLNAWQVFIQSLYLRMIFHSPLPIA